MGHKATQFVELIYFTGFKLSVNAFQVLCEVQERIGRRMRSISGGPFAILRGLLIKGNISTISEGLIGIFACVAIFGFPEQVGGAPLSLLSVFA